LNITNDVTSLERERHCKLKTTRESLED